MEQCIGNTPLVRLQRLQGANSNNNTILLKLEGNNPAGSVKDRAALNMISEAEAAGKISPGDRLIEATSGNTGIALAMAAAIKGYKIRLIMPSNMTEERRQAMAAYGAELLSVPPGDMETARDLAQEMQANGEGVVLDQFANLNNPGAHYNGTGPELWSQTNGEITHFVSSMGTTGTIMGVSRFLKEQNPEVQIVGLQPAEGASIPGIRRWSPEYLPSIFERQRVDTVMDITQAEAEQTMRALARVEGVCAGVSSGGAVSAALRLADTVSNATIAVIICDRGDRYLSTGLFSPPLPLPPIYTDPPSLRLQLQRVMGSQPLYVLFSSDLDPEGREWCPDCARATPLIQAMIAKAVPDATLLVCRVGPRQYWKDKTHPLRLDPTLQLASIPTLIKWDQGQDHSEGHLSGPRVRLDAELEACTTEREAEAVVRLFLEQSEGRPLNYDVADQPKTL